MISCKYAARLFCIGYLFTVLTACGVDAPSSLNPAWVGLDETGRFVIRKWRSDAVLEAEQKAPLLQQIQFLERRRNEGCTPTLIGVIGDTRAAFDGLGISVFFRPMLEEMAARNHEVILHVGDLVKNGDQVDEWYSYARSLAEMRPVIAVRGNHDRGPFFYDGRFGTAEVFALDYGSVRVIGFDTEGGASKVRARLPELKSLLSQATDKWKVVMLHRPIWSQGLHGNDEIGLNASLTALFDAAKVHLVLSGHDHNYERFCPTKGTDPKRRCLQLDQAPTYVVTGGGATMPNPIPTVWRRLRDPQARAAARTSVVFGGDLHFIEIEATPSRFRYSAWRTATGNLLPADRFDSFEINKASRRCSP